MYFDMVQGRTLSERGVKSVDLNTSGNDKMRFTVALTIAASGSCLPPYVLFRNLVKAPKCDNKSSMVTMGSKSGTMDHVLMLDYVKRVLFPYSTPSARNC